MSIFPQDQKDRNMLIINVSLLTSTAWRARDSDPGFPHPGPELCVAQLSVNRVRHPTVVGVRKSPCNFRL